MKSVMQTLEMKKSAFDSFLSNTGIALLILMLMLGLAADNSIWTTIYRSFVIWIVYTILASLLRVYYTINQLSREQERLQQKIAEVSELRQKRHNSVQETNDNQDKE